jgi:hypothetical protein
MKNMVSSLGFHGLIAFVAVAVVMFVVAQIPEILKILEKQLRESKGLAKRLRGTLKR